MRYLWSFSFLILYSFVGFTQSFIDYSALNLADSLKENAHDIIRWEYQKFEVTSPGNATYHLKRIVTILDEKSSFKKLHISYSPDRKLGKITAKIYDTFGRKVKDISKKEIRDFSSVSNYSIYEDDRIKYIEFHQNNYPFTIEYEYQITHDGILYYPSFDIQHGYGTALEKSVFEVHLPSNIDVNYRPFNTTLKPAISDHKTGKIYRWEVKDLPPLVSEKNSPNKYEVLPWIIISPTLFEIGNHTGSMKDWQSFGKFMYELNKGRDQLSPEMITKVKTLTANAETDKEKIEILYHYLQKNTRYVSVQLGIGGWQTFDAQYVEKNKYGDCKALTNFMKSMLAATNIKAYPALISTTDFPIPEDFALPNFNHVILNIPSENMWLECTSSHAPPNYLSLSNSDKNVLRYSEKGGELVRTPKLTAQNNNSNCSATINIQADGSAIIEQSTAFKGAFNEYYRYAASSLSKEEQKKDYYNYCPLPSFDINQWKLTADDKKPITQLDCELKVGNYVSKAGKRLFVPLNSLNPFSDIPKKMEDRKHPIELKMAYSEEDRFTFNLPESYDLESYPNEPIVLDSKFGKYEIKIQLEEDQLIYHRKLTIEDGTFPPSAYEEIRAFYKEVAKKDGIKLVLIQKPNRP